MVLSFPNPDLEFRGRFAPDREFRVLVLFMIAIGGPKGDPFAARKATLDLSRSESSRRIVTVVTSPLTDVTLRLSRHVAAHGRHVTSESNPVHPSGFQVAFHLHLVRHVAASCGTWRHGAVKIF